MAAIFDFWSEQILRLLIYKSPWCFPPSFKSISLSVQEKKWKIGFQDGCNGGHLGFPIRMILAIFNLQVSLMIPTKFRVHWAFDSGEEVKKGFQDGHHGGHLGFQIRMILAIFNLQVSLPSFKSIGLLGQDKKQKILFQDGYYGGHL